MPLAETAKLTASLDLDDSRYQAGFRRADASLSGFEKKTSGTFARIKQGFGVGVGFAAFNASIALATKGVSALSGFVQDGVVEFNQIQQAQAATAAAIKSTGGAANVSAKQISDLATSMEGVVAIEDDVIQTGANLVLRFTNVRNAAGAGNDVFNRTVKAATDMAVALNKGDSATADLSGSALLLGKALNDPVKGIARLARAGVQFSASEQKAIKDAVKHNDLLGAQRIILDKVTRLYGGAAAAAANTYAGSQAKLGIAIKNLKQSLAEGLIPGLTRASAALAEVFRSPEFIQGAKDLGTAIGSALSPENIRSFIGLARSIAGTVGQVLGALKSGWESIPPELRDLLIKGAVVDRTFKFLFGFSPAKLVVSVATDAIAKGIGGLLGGLFQRGGSPAAPMYTKEVGLPGAVGGVAAGGGLAANLTKAFSVFAIVGSVLAVIQSQQDESNKHTQEGLALQEQQNAWLKTQPNRADLVNGLAAVQKGINDIRSNPLLTLVQGDALKSLEAMEAQLKKQLEPVSSKGFTGFEGRGPGFRPEDAFKGTSSAFTKMVAKLDQLHQDFLKQLTVLSKSKDPKEIAAAAAAVAADIVKGVGNVGATKDVVATLKQQLAAIKDPETRRVLQAALARVEHKLIGREWIAAQERAAREIVASQKPTERKISELTAIQRAFTARGDTVAAGIIGRYIDSLKPHIDSIASKINITVNRLNTGGSTARPNPTGPQNRPTAPVAPRDPARNPRNNFVANVRVSATARDISNATTIHNRYGPTRSTAGAG